MFKKTVLFIAFVLNALKTVSVDAVKLTDTDMERDLRFFFRPRTYKVTLRNIAFQQPMSSFFIAVHNEDMTPSFK